MIAPVANRNISHVPDFSFIDANLKVCLAKHGDTPGVDNCYGVAKGAADRRPNDVYDGLVNALKHPAGPDDVRDDPEILRRLIAAERAWIAFRDAECSYYSSYMLGGTGEDVDGARRAAEFAMMIGSGKSFIGAAGAAEIRIGPPLSGRSLTRFLGTSVDCHPRTRR